MEHHVYFWLKDEFNTAEHRAKFEGGLAALFEIATVAGGKWSVPAKTAVRPVTENSWDYALSMRFDSMENHDSYQSDPDHDVFIAGFKDLWARVQVMDLA